jgi:hypothetical protein
MICGGQGEGRGREVEDRRVGRASPEPTGHSPPDGPHPPRSLRRCIPAIDGARSLQRLWGRRRPSPAPSRQTIRPQPLRSKANSPRVPHLPAKVQELGARGLARVKQVAEDRLLEDVDAFGVLGVLGGVAVADGGTRAGEGVRGVIRVAPQAGSNRRRGVQKGERGQKGRTRLKRSCGTEQISPGQTQRVRSNRGRAPMDAM